MDDLEKPTPEQVDDDDGKIGQVNLVVPGPDQQLVDGIEQVFRKGALFINFPFPSTFHVCAVLLTEYWMCYNNVAGIPCFGPTPEAAQLEGSKAFAKDFMARHSIPTARYATFTSHSAATAYIRSVSHRVVLKASGLALGKGVLMPTSTQEALQGLEHMMVDRAFGSAGDEVVIEEFLEGQELSVLAFCDGYTVLPLPGAQDHKRAGDNDVGLNTGGMGTYCPAPIATPDIQAQILKQVLQPTLDGMRRDGTPFVGLLFVGLVVSPAGTKIDTLEYNVRFGDPETQTLLALMAPECDLAEILMACIERRLDCVELRMKDEAAVTVVLASGGYPAAYKKGFPITLKHTPPQGMRSQLFYALRTISSEIFSKSDRRVGLPCGHVRERRPARHCRRQSPRCHSYRKDTESRRGSRLQGH